MKKRKTWSPYMTKQLKSTKVNGLRVYLQAYQTRPVNREGNPQDVTVFYYIVKAADGLNRKIMQYEEALFKYKQLIAFKKRQMEIKEGGAQ